MGNLNVKGMFLSKSDLAALAYLHSVKVATYAQIRRDIYPQYTVRSVGNRICKLEDNLLVIGTRYRFIRKGERLISITRLGFDQFVARQSERRIELKSDKPKHDLALVDIRYRFLQSKRTKCYLTENELQTWGHDDYLERYGDLVPRQISFSLLRS